MASGQVPTKDKPEPEPCEPCRKVHVPPEVVGANGVKFWPGHEYIIRTKIGTQKYPREWRMGYLGCDAGIWISRTLSMPRKWRATTRSATSAKSLRSQNERRARQRSRRPRHVSAH